jgi:hypothetical protein
MSVVVTPIITATRAEWMATTSPIVQDRVLYETDTGNYKVGDGTSQYSALPYSQNYATFTNYVFMVPLDDLGALFTSSSSSSSSGGVVSLWQPGPPTIADWTPFNPAFTNAHIVTDQGANTVSITCPGQLGTDAFYQLNDGTPQLGGFMIAPPTAPYKVLLGFKSISVPIVFTATDVDQNVDTVTTNGLPMAVGWSDGTSYFCMTPPSNTYQMYAAPLQFYHGDFGSSTSDGANSISPTQASLQSPDLVFYILSDDGNGNVTFSETLDGKTENVLWTSAKSAVDGVPVSTFTNIFIAFGCPSAQNTNGPIGGSMTSFFLYDTNVAARTPRAPAY